MESGNSQSRKRKRTSTERVESQSQIEEVTGEGTGTGSSMVTTDAANTAVVLTNALEVSTGFDSLLSYRAYLNSLTSRDEQYQSLMECAQKWNDEAGKYDQLAEILDDTINQLKLSDLAAEHQDELWNRVKSQAAVSRNQRDEKDQAKNKVFNILGRDNIERDFEGIQHQGTHTWKQLRTLTLACQSKGLDYDMLKRAILQTQLARVLNPTKGTSNSLQVVASDFLTAAKHVKNNTLKDNKTLRSELNAQGYGTLYSGLLATAEDDQHYGGSPASIRSRQIDEDDADAGVAKDLISQLRVAKSFDDETPNDDEEIEDFDEDYDKTGDYEYDITEDADVAVESEETMDVDDEDTDTDDVEMSTDDEPTGRSRNKKKTGHNCGCDASIPIGFIRQLKKGFRPGEIAQSLLIRNWYKHRQTGVICYNHTRWMFSALQMKSKGYGHDGLEDVLHEYHNATITHKLGDFKSADATYVYFRKGARPSRPDDSLGVYKYVHNRQALVLEFKQEHQAQLQIELNINMQEWNDVGSINMDGMSWWKDYSFAHEGTTIFDVAEQEFDMYDHHLRMINGKANYGWLRTMYHGLAQQAMRQDPWYWMMYVALRGDRNHNLVSYPYYCKYQHPGDSTFFRHIDINLPQLMEHGQGIYQIQGTLSLDDEIIDDCTEILPGMHNNVGPWTKDLMKREGVRLGAAVHLIRTTEYNADDKKKYGIDWTAVPCKALEVRITDPRLPHGAQGPAKISRRTLLPWYVSLQTGLHHLEIGEAGTWEDLAKAHRDLTNGPRSPSGLPNRYGHVPYSFPAAVPLTGLGPLSDALVCRIRHDAVPVIRIKKQLLLSGPNARIKYLHEWRLMATRAVVIAWKEVKAAELEYYGDKSYFALLDRKARGINNVVFDPDLDESTKHVTRGGHGHEFDEAQRIADEESSGEDTEGSSDEAE